MCTKFRECRFYNVTVGQLYKASGSNTPSNNQQRFIVSYEYSINPRIHQQAMILSIVWYHRQRSCRPVCWNVIYRTLKYGQSFWRSTSWSHSIHHPSNISSVIPGRSQHCRNEKNRKNLKQPVREHLLPS